MNTALDRAHAAMQADEGEAARRSYYARLAASELHLLLTGLDPPTPEAVTIDATEYVLAFDSAGRLARFAEGDTVPTATMAGRDLVAQLAGTGTGLGINLGVADSAFLLPPAAVDWLAAVAPEPVADDAAIVSVHPLDPDASDPGQLDLLFAGLAGHAARAFLATGRDKDGTHYPLIAFDGVGPNSAPVLIAAIAEHFAITGAPPPVVLPDPPPALRDRLGRVALVFDLPKPAQRTGPGLDPERPPRLR